MGVMERPIVFDLGTGYMKVGWAGENFPEKVFPTIVGKPILRSKRDRASSEAFSSDLVVGEKCDEQEGFLDTPFPVTNGVITDAENMNVIWDYCFKDVLQTPGADQTVMVTEAAGNPLEHRKKL